MNFHKTIGFLTTLLLMLGIGVPDSFAQEEEPAIAETLALSLTRNVLRDTATVHNMRLTVRVSLDKPATVETMVTVALSEVDPDSKFGATFPVGDTPNTSDVEITFAVNDQAKIVTRTVAVVPAADADGDPETGKITGTITNPDGIDATTDDITAEATFTIEDYSRTFAVQDAQDARGYRVRITKAVASATGWVKAGNTVNVQVQRRNHIGAHFGRFSSIEVALRDSIIEAPLFAITVRGQRTLGNLSLDNWRGSTLTLPDDAASVSGAVDKVVYTKRTSTSGYDILEFRFKIPVTPPHDNLQKVYALVTFNSSGSGTPAAIANTETKKFLVPDNESVFPNEKVGDGKVLKLDNNKPLETILQEGSLRVSLGSTGEAKEEVVIAGSVGVARLNQQINIEIDIDAFSEDKVKFQLFATEGLAKDDDRPKDPIIEKQAVTGYAKTFNASQVYSADVLRDSVKVNSALKVKYPDEDPSGDQDYPRKQPVPADHIVYDNLKLRVRVAVLDKAGNSTNQIVAEESAEFLIDSKLPQIKILYPKPSATDSARFSAGVFQEYDFVGEDFESQALKPLLFSVDEEAATTWVIIGTDTLDATDVEPERDSENNDLGYDLSTLDLKASQKARAEDEENDHPMDDAAVGGSEVDLKVVIQDAAGNKGTGTPDGQAVFDTQAPTISKLFPNTGALPDNKIGGAEQTQNPVFRMDEVTDSILVRYESGAGDFLSVIGTAGDLLKVGENIRIPFSGDNALADGETYNLQVYARDLVGHVGVSTRQDGLIFDNTLQNPQAGGFEIVSEVRDNTLAKDAVDIADEVTVYAEMDSVVAGQALRLTITAIDENLADRPAITYAKDGVEVVAMDSGGNPISGVSFWGSGVMNIGGGTATLDADGWLVGEREVFLKSTMAGLVTVAVKDKTAEDVLNFMGTTDITVAAADFNKFVITAWEEGVDEAATSVWEDFNLLVQPTDQFGNSSLKVFRNDGGAPGTGTGKADSLNLLDTRAKGANKIVKYSDVDVALFANYTVDGLPREWPIGANGFTFPVTAPDRPGKQLTIQARIVTTSLDAKDDRSNNAKGNVALAISQPVEISITLWVPGAEGDQAGNDVTIPAGGSVTVTARAEGLNEDDMVTFTVDGEAQDAVAADADGYAGQPIELSGSGTVSVTASSGQYSAILDVVYEEAPAEEGRKAYVDSNDDPVYLIAKDSGTVGVDDFLALVAAFGSSEGDDNYNPQADVNDDGSVGVDDILVFVGSFGKTAAVSGKPIVLLPGINENAEFSLSLGSDGVVAGELMAVDVSLANVEALIGYGFALNYDADKFEFVSVASADEDLLTSTGGETLFHHVVADGQISVATGMYNGTAVSGGGDIVRFVFRVLYEFEDNARFEIADGLVFDPSQLQNPAVVAGVLELQSTPREFALHQNFPNPFNPDTTIKYDLAESADVTLQIYNVLGQVVRTLVASEAQNAGRYQIRWNGMDDRGVSVSSGIYFYRISAGEFQNVRKLMLLK